VTPPNPDARITAAEHVAGTLIEAVGARDQQAVHTLLRHLDPGSLHALAVVLADQVHQSTSLTPERLLVAVEIAAGRFHTTPGRVTSRSGRVEDQDARAVVAYAAWLLGYPQSVTGRAIRRDRSTVLAAISRVGATPRLRRVATGIASDLGWSREDNDIEESA